MEVMGMQVVNMLTVLDKIGKVSGLENVQY